MLADSSSARRSPPSSGALAAAMGSTHSATDGSPWHEATLQAKWAFPPHVSSVTRRDKAWRFDSSDQQFELEAYPSFRPGTTDVGFAFSPTNDLYPKYRVQADLYQMLPLGLEAAVGYRHMQFGSAVNMVVLVLSKYYAYLALRGPLVHHARRRRHQRLGIRNRPPLPGPAHAGLTMATASPRKSSAA